MNIIGLIAEYNPFHYGHKYQIDKIKELYPDSIIIAIISTNFTQRGDISIINKWNKTKICLDNNIDLVVELPYSYTVESADIFAKGALAILNKLKIDTLVFGTEREDINILKKLAYTEINNKKFNKKVKDYLDKGLNYPTALSKALKELTGYEAKEPNDLLAISYIKEIIKNNYNINPINIKRTIGYHSKDIKNNITSASNIRELLKNNKSIKKYIPYNEKEYFNTINYDKLFSFLKYNIINNIDNLNDYVLVEEGIENRIKKYIFKSNTWEELINNIKTKRYTYNRINRMLINILNNYKKIDHNINDIYIKVLGFNTKGKEYLNSIKKDLNIIHGYKKNISKILDIEFKSTCIYSEITNDKYLIDLEIKNKPIIIK